MESSGAVARARTSRGKSQSSRSSKEQPKSDSLFVKGLEAMLEIKKLMHRKAQSKILLATDPKSAVAAAVRDEYCYALAKAKGLPKDPTQQVELNKGTHGYTDRRRPSSRSTRGAYARRSLISTGMPMKEAEVQQRPRTVQDLLTKIPFLTQTHHQKLEYNGKAPNWHDQEFLASCLTTELLESIVEHLQTYL